MRPEGFGPPQRPPMAIGESGLPLIPVEDSEKLNFRGVAADYLEDISEITGIKFMVTFAGRNNFREMTDALLQDQADLMPTFMLQPNSSEMIQARGLHITQPYISLPVVLVTRPDVPYIDNMETLKSMKLAGTLPTGGKLRALGLRLRFEHASPREGLIGVATGKFDAFIGELSSVSVELSQRPVANIKISGELPAPSEFAMVVGPQIREFIPIFNKALAAIPSEKKDIIWRKWFRINYEKTLVSSSWIKIAFAAGIVLLVAALFAIRHYYSRFNKMRTTVEALNPHLLSVHVDRNIMITEVTEALCNATGFTTDDLVGKPLMALGSPASEERGSMDYIWKTLEKRRTWRGEVKIVKKDGSSLWAEAIISPLRRKSDNDVGFTIIYQDVTQQKHYEKLAVRDELTGLYNRRHFNATVKGLLHHSQKNNRHFALILLDLDNFKKYNDNYGHPAGDRILTTIGNKLREIFQRNNDMVFRLGGEEFGAAVVVSSRDDAVRIAEKVLDGVRALKIEHKYNPPGIVTVSIGVTVTTNETKPDLEAIYKKADAALYQAKENGRNTFVVL